MSEIVTAICECKDYSEDNLVNAESKNYWTAMSGGRKFFHIFMLVLTGFIWLGWITGGFIFTKAEYECVSCGNKIHKSNLRIGGKTNSS